MAWEMEKKRIWPTCLLAGLACALVFGALYGFALINPQNTAWIMNPEKDLYQSYLGWLAYRTSDWRFPIGLYDRFSYPAANSIIFTDSLPLFAVFFKLFRNHLPASFQYYGIWTAFCYFMSGMLGARILHKYTDSHLAAFFGAGFFSFVPALLLRTMVHSALCGQWLILLALGTLFLYREIYHRSGPALALWGFLGILAVFVHMYFVLICGIVLVGYCLCSIIDTRRVGNALRCLVGYIGTALLGVWLLGGFSTGLTADQATEIGFGEFSFNLNSLWNARDKDPQGIWALFRKLPWIDEAKQAEGFSYLGLGILLMLVIALVVLIWRLLSGSRIFITETVDPSQPYTSAGQVRRGVSRRRDNTTHTSRGADTKLSRQNAGTEPTRRTNAALAAGYLVTAILALSVSASNVVTFNDQVLFRYPLPGFVQRLMDTFRSSGRVSWILVYLIMLAALILTLRMHSARAAVILLALLLAVQGGEALLDGRVEPVTLPENTEELDFASTPLGQAILEQEEILHILFTTPMEPKDYYYFGRFAAEHDLTLNDFWFARPAHEAATEAAAKILSELPEDTIIVFYPVQKDEFAKHFLYYYDAGDYVVGSPIRLPVQSLTPPYVEEGPAAA